jgi:hypothetical protein
VAFIPYLFSFHYDHVSKRWIIDPELKSEAAGVSLTEQQALEEHGLVLAIQAAHAHLLGLDERYDNNRDLEAGAATDVVVDELATAFGIGSVQQAGGKVSAQVFLICATLHLLGRLLHTGLLAVVPIWCALPGSRGGLDKSPVECALAFSATAVIVFLLRGALGIRTGELCRLSPVRAARLASATVFTATLLLPWVAPRGLPNSPFSLFTSLLSVCLLSLLFCGVLVHRTASSALCIVCLSASFTSPTTIVLVTGGLADVLGPFSLAMVTASVFRLGAPYPLDASFFFFLAAATSGLLYCSTLLLLVQFRGNQGTVSDSALLRDQGRFRSGRRVIGESASVMQGFRELLLVPFGKYLWV